MINGLPHKWTEIFLSFLRLHPSTAFWAFLLIMRATPFLLKRFLPIVVDRIVFWVKFARPIHIGSLIPKVSVFTLAISCLTTSSLPWFMDLTFQVPMQYCSLQHQTLLSPPGTFTTLDHKEGWALEELMLSNCGTGKDSWESLGQQADQTSQS